MDLKWFALLIAVTLAADCALENFAIGDVNITSEAQFKNLTKENELFLLGVSAKWCKYCCHYEPIYKQVIEVLDTLTPRIKLARADIAKTTFIKRFMAENDEVPVIYAVKNGKFYKYHDYLNFAKIVNFVDRMYLPVLALNTEAEIEQFLTPPEGNENFLTLVAFIYDDDEAEDSLAKQYEKVSLALANWVNCKVGIVRDKALIKDLKKREKWIPYLNSLVLSKRGADNKVLDLALPQSLGNWITRNGVGLVEEVTPYNYQIYKGIGLPMLIMFLDKNNVNIDEYLDIFKKVARDFEDQIKFVWLDGTEEVNKQRKRKIGLVTEILPSLAFNLADGRIYPYLEGKPITRESIAEFVTEFLENKHSVKNVPDYKPDIELEKLYKDTPIVTRETFDDLVLAEGFDVVVLFYSSHKNQGSYTIAPYFNKLAKRYGELEFSNLRVYRMDIAIQSVHKFVRTDTIPSIYLFPAFHKQPPYIRYPGDVSNIIDMDVLKMMFFVEKYVDVKFELPDVPHLSPDEAEEYWDKKSKLSPDQQQEEAKKHEIRKFDL